MGARSRQELLGDLAASAHIAASAVAGVLEGGLLEQTARGRLTAVQLKLLKLVALTERHSLGDVAAFLGISPAAASKAVDKLVRSALLRRSESPEDRRLMELALTPAGARLLEAYEEARTLKLKQIAARFAPEELEQAGEVLDRLAAVLLDGGRSPDQLCIACGMYFRPRCRLRELIGGTCFYESRGLRRTDPAPPA